MDEVEQTEYKMEQAVGDTDGGRSRSLRGSLIRRKLPIKDDTTFRTSTFYKGKDGEIDKGVEKFVKTHVDKDGDGYVDLAELITAMGEYKKTTDRNKFFKTLLCFGCIFGVIIVTANAFLSYATNELAKDVKVSSNSRLLSTGDMETIVSTKSEGFQAPAIIIEHPIDKARSLKCIEISTLAAMYHEESIGTEVVVNFRTTSGEEKSLAHVPHDTMTEIEGNVIRFGGELSFRLDDPRCDNALSGEDPSRRLRAKVAADNTSAMDAFHRNLKELSQNRKLTTTTYATAEVYCCSFWADECGNSQWCDQSEEKCVQCSGNWILRIDEGTCGYGYVGNGVCADSSLCCSPWGWCDDSTEHCSGNPAPTPTPPPADEGTCGNGSRGNGICADPSLCCSEYGWCGSTAQHCSGNPTPTPPPADGTTPTNNDPAPNTNPTQNAPTDGMDGMLTMWSSSPTEFYGGKCEYAGAGPRSVTEDHLLNGYIYPSPGMYCAIASGLFNNGESCGDCYRVSWDGVQGSDPGTPGSADIQVVDENGAGNAFDCFVDAFHEITGAYTGEFNIKYEKIECAGATEGHVIVMPEDLGNAYYTKVLFAGGPSGVKSVKVIIDDQPYPLTIRSGATFAGSLGGKSGSNVHIKYEVEFSDGGFQTIDNDCHGGVWPAVNTDDAHCWDTLTIR